MAIALVKHGQIMLMLHFFGPILGLVQINKNKNKSPSMKTKSVKFSYGTVKDASLKIPAEAYCIHDIVQLIRQSYLEYAFRPGCGLMSDEVLTSSIGHSNFFAGALGGYKTRLDAETFAALERCADDDIGMAVAIVKFRRCNAGISQAEVYTQAAKNTVLSESVRAFFLECAKMEAAK